MARSTERSEFTFLVSVLVPKCTEPRGASDVFTSQRSDPSSIRIRDPERPHQVTQFGDVGSCDLRSGLPCSRDWLGHDLGKRNAGPVVIDERVIGAMDAP